MKFSVAQTYCFRTKRAGTKKASATAMQASRRKALAQSLHMSRRGLERYWSCGVPKIVRLLRFETGTRRVREGPRPGSIRPFGQASQNRAKEHLYRLTVYFEARLLYLPDV